MTPATRPLAAALLALLAPGLAAAFPLAPPGSAIANRTLPAISGAKAPLLAEGRANVFVFFRPGHEPSRQALAGLARLEKEFRKKPVRFVAVASPSFGKKAAEAAVRSAGAAMPVLLDPDDALYGELGVTHHPAVGIASADGRLSGYQPWLSVHLVDSLRAHVRHALGEIDELQLTAELDPDPSGGCGPRAEARARAQFARMLLVAGQCDMARRELAIAVRLDPDAEGESRIPCAAAE